VVLEGLAPQLGLLPMLLANYPRDEKTRWAHLERIRRHLGFVRCERAQRQQLLEHLTSVARGVPRTESLRRAAHAWLLDHHVVRPRRTTLRDLVASARETGLQQTYDALTRDLSEAQRSRLDGLLATPETPVSPNASPKVVDDETADEPRSRLDRFKVPPHRESPAVLLGLLERLVERERTTRGERGGERLVLELSSERRQVGPETEPVQWPTRRRHARGVERAEQARRTQLIPTTRLERGQGQHHSGQEMTERRHAQLAHECAEATARRGNVAAAADGSSQSKPTVGQPDAISDLVRPVDHLVEHRFSTCLLALRERHAAKLE
jgi:hypothetical protein